MFVRYLKVKWNFFDDWLTYSEAIGILKNSIVIDHFSLGKERKREKSTKPLTSYSLHFSCACMVTFNTIVRPILEYASQVWSPHNAGLAKELEMVLRHAFRWAYRLTKMESVSDPMENTVLSPWKKGVILWTSRNWKGSNSLEKGGGGLISGIFWVSLAPTVLDSRPWIHIIL